MLLPNDMKPESSIFYYGAIILKKLSEQGSCDIISLFESIKIDHDLSLKVFSYCLDWLYLIETVVINEEGEVRICI